MWPVHKVKLHQARSVLWWVTTTKEHRFYSFFISFWADRRWRAQNKQYFQVYAQVNWSRKVSDKSSIQFIFSILHRTKWQEWIETIGLKLFKTCAITQCWWTKVHYKSANETGEKFVNCFTLHCLLSKESFRILHDVVEANVCEIFSNKHLKKNWKRFHI